RGGGGAGGPRVGVSRSGGGRGVAVTVRTDGRPGGQAPIASHAELPPPPVPRPGLFTAGGREIRTALLLPSWHEPGSGKLPVLLDPYGGAHTQRGVAAEGAFGGPQWVAGPGVPAGVAP